MSGYVITTAWPAYDGSVQTSWYPVWLVLTTRSPPADTGAPNATPGKTVPSSSARSAGPRSPIRGSTIDEARGAGGTITRRRYKTTHPPQGRGGHTGARTSIASFAGL